MRPWSVLHGFVYRVRFVIFANLLGQWIDTMTWLQRWQQLSHPTLKLGVLWVASLFIFNFYCLFWRHYVGGTRWDFIDSQLFWVKEWGALWVLSMAAIYALTRSQRVYKPLLLSCAVVSVLLLSYIRVSLNFDFYGPNWAGAVINLLPKYTFAVLLVMGAIYLSLVTKVKARDSVNGADIAPACLTVQHRGMEKALAISDIQYVRAAGNYVEVVDADSRYLVRTTIKQLSEQLGAAPMIRVHRSYLINLHHVRELKPLENGKAQVLVGEDHWVPVSKTFKPALKQVLTQSTQPGISSQTQLFHHKVI
ncbi:hypothetical protein CWC05_06905 [Pseudoalteromonas ruthenica]|uniref:HTH LytTR-type domain-containing protein n=1 Tax=Pseudoalteromonas ruthenica TaxID=151081 RepID=A0A5S3Z5Q1_9GAMM|nr:LytTR family DNA-binding domain-containing protein [Pseudoalteromonas ruthenica]TMP87579.1 hypothetical protein CWC05_06905 [Pseudoalteromonas ruthenica]